MGTEKRIFDKLVGSAMYHKDEKHIKSRDFMDANTDFRKLQNFWGKACFLVFLEDNPHKGIKAISGKIRRKLMATEGAVYNRHILPLYKDIKKMKVIDSTGEAILDKVVEQLYDFGEDDFIILCRAINNSKSSDYLKTYKNKVSIPHGRKKEINRSYGERK